MYILGISDGRINSAATLLRKTGNCYRILSYINEERITRDKLKGGFPKLSLNQVIKDAKITYKDIDKIVFGGILTPNIILRVFRRLNYHALEGYKNLNLKTILIDIIEHKSGMSQLNKGTILGRFHEKILTKIILKDLPRELRKKPIYFIDHHLCHAASAFYTSGMKEALCITCDGRGDGISFSVNIGRKNRLEKIFEISSRDSLGKYYSLITSYLGFKEFHDEGKITGLAAYGNHKNIKTDFPFRLAGEKLTYKGSFGLKGMKECKEKLSVYKKEDIASWIQFNTESIIIELIKRWIKKTGIKDIDLAGGVFSNVKLNQKINEIKEARSVYIFPQMDDAGLALGAALELIKPKPKKLEHLFYGNEYSEKEILRAIKIIISKNKSLRYQKLKNIEKKIAQKISEGKILGRFDGRMEFGPRALGNRSILCDPRDEKINTKLNKKLNRTEFMPFAPAVLEEYADKCFKDIKGSKHAAEFMTITFNCTEWIKKKCKAAVHIDGTSRPQLVLKRNNPKFYKIIKEFNKITGIPMIINTSFNMHKEPIVSNPYEAFKTFQEGKLDVLILGDYMIENIKE